MIFTSFDLISERSLASAPEICPFEVGTMAILVNVLLAVYVYVPVATVVHVQLRMQHRDRAVRSCDDVDRRFKHCGTFTRTQAQGL
jgi:hypothetical protein